MLDYEALSNLLCDEIGVEMFRTYIYDCELRSNERLLNSLNKITGFEVKKGTIQHNERGYRRKQCVDILLALDMIKLSSKNNRIDNIILVTGNGDFTPVVKYVKDETVRVHLRTGSSYSKELADACDTSEQIKEDLIFNYGDDWRKARKKMFRK